jgi:hypothetical protein
MPPQKNSGNKGAKRETGASSKNRRFVQNFMDDLRAEGGVEHVHIARVLRRLGDGRMEVFFTEKVKGNDSKGRVAQAVIRGSFRGRGKHSVWIDFGSIVAIAETGVAGPSALEIVAVLTADQMRDIGREIIIDPRVLAVDATDTTQLLSSKMTMNHDVGYEFDGVIEEDDDEQEVDVDNI